jgi:asparagine synthetase B (glutamine-hydrolysing)
VLLSGGLDSSVIAAIAARVCSTRIENEGKSVAWWPSLHSFSVGLKDSPDLRAARIVADHIKSVHHEFHFTIEEGLNALSDVIYHLETYDVTTIRAATPMYLMARKSQNQQSCARKTKEEAGGVSNLSLIVLCLFLLFSQMPRSEDGALRRRCR